LDLGRVEDGRHLIDDDTISVDAVASIEVVLEEKDAKHTGNDHGDDKETNGKREQHLHLAFQG
jgi:hypothetical protein